MQAARITSPSGLAFTIGCLAAIASLIAGLVLVGPSVAEQTAVQKDSSQASPWPLDDTSEVLRMNDAVESRLAHSTGGSMAVRSAAALHVGLGLGFGVGAVVTLVHYTRHGELPMTPWGFRSLAGGPFESLDSGRFTALVWTLVVVSALDVLAGIWLWQGRRRGLRLSIATTAPALGLSVGFALPFLLVGVPIRLALAVAGRRHLR